MLQNLSSAAVVIGTLRVKGDLQVYDRYWNLVVMYANPYILPDYFLSVGPIYMGLLDKGK